jgi:hypothetical protein
MKEALRHVFYQPDPSFVEPGLGILNPQLAVPVY